MNLKIYVFAFILFLPACLFPADNFVEEKIVLRAHYGFFTAGYADLVTQNKRAGNECFQLTSLNFKTTKFVEKLFRFNYAFESCYNGALCYPEKFSYHLVEKKLNVKDTIRFYHEDKYLDSQKHGRVKFKNPPRDILAVISYLRKINWDNSKEGDMRSFDIFFTNEEIFPVKIYYQGKEKIKTDLKTYECIKLFLTSEAGKLFASESKVSIYLSNDKDKIPVMFSVDLVLGSFKLDLAEYTKK